MHFLNSSPHSKSCTLEYLDFLDLSKDVKARVIPLLICCMNAGGLNLKTRFSTYHHKKKSNGLKSGDLQKCVPYVSQTKCCQHGELKSLGIIDLEQYTSNSDGFHIPYWDCQSQSSTIHIKGGILTYCTPNLKLACFVCYLKLYQHFFFGKIMHAS